MGVGILKNIKLLLCIFSLLFCFGEHAHSEERILILVVANTGGEPLELTKQEVKSLFMGAFIGRDLDAVSLPPSNPTRVLFNTLVLGLTEDRIQSYWAQMRFSGRKKTPLELSDESDVLSYLLETPGAIAYLPASVQVPAELSVVYPSN